MAGSAAEREVRDALVASLREQSNGRIVHELVVGWCRADVALIETERLVLFEIKSSRDTLDRLEKQAKAFTAASHHTIVVAHARWFEEFDYKGGGRGYKRGPGLESIGHNVPVWRYPKPVQGEFLYPTRWELPRLGTEQPHAARFLELLWKSELLAECKRHRIAATTRTTCGTMVTDMAYLMTGREIAQAVSRQLRGRPFPEADAPVAP